MRNWKTGFLALSAALLLLAGGSPAWADSFSVTTVFDCLGGGGSCPQESEHEEGTGLGDANFKGWVYLSVTNTGTEDWGDFHFGLFQVTDPITNVFFDDSAPNQPTSNRTGLASSVSSGGHVLDVFFYGDPVGVGETLNINVFTNNVTDQVTFFGTLYYPTPIPEPGTAALVGLSLLGLLAAVRRARR